jgi:hypothetical protein
VFFYFCCVNLKTTLKYNDFLRASGVKSEIWPMFCISKTRADRKTLVLFLESAGQIYSETSVTFESPKCVLTGVISAADLVVIYPSFDQHDHAI